MRTILLGLALAGLSCAALAQTTHRYQLFAVTPRASELGFVDVASIDRTSAAVSYWSLSVYEPPAQISNSLPVIYQLRQRIADCARRRTRDQIVVARLQNGDERWISLVGQFRPVRSGTIGDTELTFVCSGKPPAADLPSFATTEDAVRFADTAAARQPGRPASSRAANPDQR